MKNGSSPGRQRIVDACVELLERADRGQLEGLPCPECKYLAVSVWFKGWEKTWFKCGKCSFDSLAINSSKPASYVVERDLNASKGVVTAKI